MSDDEWGNEAACMSDEDADWGTAGDDGDDWDEGIQADNDASLTSNTQPSSSPNLSVDIRIANLFYEAEDCIRDEPQQALDKFQQLKLLALEHRDKLSDESRTSLFQSLQYSCKLLFRFQRLHEMMTTYEDLLQLIPSVTRNEGADAIDSILSQCNQTDNATSGTFFEQLYQLTLSTLSTLSDTERMAFNVQLKLARTQLDQCKLDSASQALQQLHNSCKTTDGRDDAGSKASELLEIYALKCQLAEVQQHSLSQQPEALRQVYEATRHLSAAVKDPRSLSILREHYGYLFSHNAQWSKAYTEFYAAFTLFQECGQRDRAKRCLAYVVIANMLSSSEQNPFDAREAKVYAQDKDIRTIVELRQAYEKCDVQCFNSRLKDIQQRNDEFILKHLSAMMRDFQCKVLLRLAHNYSVLKLSYCATVLSISVECVEMLLVQLILDGELDATIDQQLKMLYVGQINNNSLADEKYALIQQWTNKLQRMQTTLCAPPILAE